MQFLRVFVAVGALLVAAADAGEHFRRPEKQVDNASPVQHADDLNIPGMFTKASGWADSMLAAVNAERAKNGLGALCMNSKLTRAAQDHSQDQANTGVMSHVGSTGSTLQTRIDGVNYDWSNIAENVAAGQSDVAEVMKSWMNSPGHRANILGDYTMVGFGLANNPSTVYKNFWTQDFGKGSHEQCDNAPTQAPAPTTQRPTQTPAPTQTQTPAPTTTAPPPPPKTTTPAPAPTQAPPAPTVSIKPNNNQQQYTTTAPPSTNSPAVTSPRQIDGLTSTETPAASSNSPASHAGSVANDANGNPYMPSPKSSGTGSTTGSTASSTLGADASKPTADSSKAGETAVTPETPAQIDTNYVNAKVNAGGRVGLVPSLAGMLLAVFYLLV